MLHLLIPLCIVLACWGCQQHGRDATGSARDGGQSRSGVVTGKDAYEQACASCHEGGRDGAPKTGEPAAWTERSALWEAVLFEHAQQGSLDMPAHGTDGRFSDDTIAAAARYMLEITHPDRPPD